MKEIVTRLQENRQIGLAKSILESNGYKVSKKMNESEEHAGWEYSTYSGRGPWSPDFYFREVDELDLMIYPPQKGADGLYYDDWSAEIQGQRCASSIDGIQEGFDSFEEAEAWINSQLGKLKESHRVAKRSKRLKESESWEPKEGSYYAIAIDAATNAPGTKYYGPERVQIGKEILKSAGISDPKIEVTTQGYDDISFIIESDDKKYVDRIARKIAAYAEEPSEQDYDQPENTVVAISGPYDNEYCDNFTDEVETWYR